MRMKVTFSDEEQAAIESLRGPLPAATWVRRLVRQAGVAAAVLEAAEDEVVEGRRDRAGLSPVPAPNRPPEREIVRAAAASSERAWPAGVRPMRFQPRPIVGKK